MRYRLLIDCPGGRFHAGDIGEAIPNDFEENYDYRLALQGKGKRIFYFHRGEVEQVAEVGVTCPKCKRTSGDDWSQCEGSCPMPGSPHFNEAEVGREPTLSLMELEECVVAAAAQWNRMRRLDATSFIYAEVDLALSVERYEKRKADVAAGKVCDCYGLQHREDCPEWRQTL